MTRDEALDREAEAWARSQGATLGDMRKGRGKAEPTDDIELLVLEAQRQPVVPSPRHGRDSGDDDDGLSDFRALLADEEGLTPAEDGGGEYDWEVLAEVRGWERRQRCTELRDQVRKDLLYGAPNEDGRFIPGQVPEDTLREARYYGIDVDRLTRAVERWGNRAVAAGGMKVERRCVECDKRPPANKSVQRCRRCIEKRRAAR